MAEENLKELCEELWQRPPTDQELSDVQRVKDLFGMKTTDSFFVALLAMHWFDGKARRGREEMVAAIETATASAKERVGAEVSGLAAQAIVNIQDRVSEGVRQAAGTAIADVGATKRSISLAGVLALVMVSLFTGGAIQSALDAPRVVAVGVMDSLLFSFLDYVTRSGAGYFYISLALGVLLLHDMRHRSIRSFGGFVVSCALISFGLWPLIAAVASVIR